MNKNDNVPSSVPRPACEINLEGVVQGVGMRPFVYRLATEMEIRGWVSNTGSGIKIHAEGGQLELFQQRLLAEAPVLAKIRAVRRRAIPAAGYTTFVIAASARDGCPDALITPDVAVCPDCLAEMRTAGDRRYRYPFINCTNCGPRYTIIRGRPYDRIRTTMAGFELCPACADDYNNVLDRRFHAQPVACPVCGPHLTYWDENGQPYAEKDEALRKAQAALADGKIVAIKGLGGYHLACDGADQAAIRRLRLRKERRAKPLALMARDVAAVAAIAELNTAEQEWLTSAAAPIVLLERRLAQNASLPDDLAPGLSTLGFILPYTPLHHLLFQEAPYQYLVMTSANLSGRPLIYQDEEALAQLSGIADGILAHNRRIEHPCDDSVVRYIGDRMTFYRRARGYVPAPLAIGTGQAEPRPDPGPNPDTEPEQLPSVLAVGGDMKNVFCLTEGRWAYVSPYLGEMSDGQNFERFRQEVTAWQNLWCLAPDLIAGDAHPDYVTAQWIRRTWDRSRRRDVYHHHAHLASVMGEWGLEQPVLGLIADGTGYGADGRIWGCEVLYGDAAAFTRLAHLEYLPLPGGEAGIRFPLRTAYAYLIHLTDTDGLPNRWRDMPVWQDLPVWQALRSGEREVIRAQVESNTYIVPTSSAGRLFDAVAALLSICQTVSYEGQAAIELESAAVLWRREAPLGPAPSPLYPVQWESPQEADSLTGQPQGPARIKAGRLLAALCEDLLEGRPPGEIAWKFHLSLAAGLVHCLEQVRPGIDKKICLSGGVFQNKLFTEEIERLLRECGWQVFRARELPPGDGGLAYGQACIVRRQALEALNKS